MKPLKLTLLTAAVVLFAVGTSAACTSAVVSGRVTKDGKPLLWKHRDTGVEQNHIKHFQGPKYSFTGLIDSKSEFGEAVWIGTNSAGFSIMNTASYNLKNDTLQNLAELEGAVMKLALGVCKDLKDFETFLDTLSKPRCVEANFGVIDAFGGAAYYETNNFEYFKTNVNDPMVAPHGYIIRTNFSFSGRVNQGMGYMRYQTAEYLFAKATAVGTITPEWIFSSATRSFYNPQLEVDLTNELYAPTNGWVIDQDFIPRNSSSASVVIQGVKTGANPELTTMWCVLGYPPCSMAVPVWEKSGNDLPALLTNSASSQNAPMCELAVKLKHTVFPINRGNGQKYLHFGLLYNKRGDGIMQVVAPIEKQTFKYGKELLALMEKSGYNKTAVADFYNGVNKQFEALNQAMTTKFELK